MADPLDIPNNFDNLPAGDGGPSDGGFSGQHQRIEHLLQIGPTTEDQKNTFRPALFPIACWRIDDVRFEFDSSVIKTDAQPELLQLKALLAANPKAPLSVFGHADPTGSDDYNKHLSGRRAQAIYGLLTRKTDLWEDIYSDNSAGDAWGDKAFQSMRTSVGTSGSVPNTKANRKTVFAAYMDLLCGPDFVAAPGDFLAQGSDPKGKGDYQGCSDFNPYLVFSKDEHTAFQPAAKHPQRDQENAPNRRVMIFLFRPGSVVNTGKWPCPRVKEGTGACRKRFWSDGEKRRSNQAVRRKFPDTRDTFACRFYDRLSSGSPCEGGAIPPLPNLRIYLKLTWKDPEGKFRPFPPDFPVIVRSPAGELNEKVGEAGALSFDFPRSNKVFTLRFEHPDQYIGSSSATSKDTHPERYLEVADVDAAVKDAYRVFRLPHKWSLLQSDWPTVKHPHYNNTEARFEGLGSFSANVGSSGAPLEMQLDPHWNFVRFEFFDRMFGHSNHAGKRIGLPPMLLDGFRAVPLVKGPAPDPETRSNWAINLTDNDQQTQALPWILQRKLDKSPDVKPDAAIMLQLVNPKGTFAVSPDAISRTTEVITDQARLAPGPDRLKLYDLPELWKSTKYFTRGSGNDKWFDKVTPGEVLAANDATKPLVFSLDDIVLTDPSLQQQAVAGDQLALIFFHQFKKPASGGANISPEGIYKIGADATKTFFPYTDIAMPVKYYVHDYPDWTRLVIVNGNMYEAFAERTPDAGANEVVGARAAVNWEDAVAAGQPPTNQINPRPALTNKAFFAIQPFFAQDVHKVRSRCLPQGTYPEWQSPVASFSGFFYGRFDQTLLRCCDEETGNEVGINLQFFRFHYDFTTPPTLNADNTAFNPADYKKKMLTNIPKRWNGPETVTFADGTTAGANPGDFLIKPQTADTPKLQIRPYFYAQELPLPRAHFKLNIINVPRANMNSGDGIGNFSADNEAPQASGWFTAAHETGHGDGLPDEYNERWSDNACSYEFQGFGSQVPGDPYSVVKFALMMEGVFFIEGRYFWHAAEWIRGVLGNVPMQVESGPHKFLLPPHPSAPARTFVHIPAFIESRASTGTRGLFDSYLYAFGDDPFRGRIKTGVVYDGILTVLVKIRVHFDSVATHSGVVNPINNLITEVDSQLNRRFVFSGTLGPITYTNCLVHFMPRILVETLVADGTPANNAYLGGLGYNPPSSATQSNYSSKVSDVESNHPRHFTLRVVASGATGWKSGNELRLTAAQLSSPGVWAWFADMVGIDCSALAAPIIGMTNAKVQSSIVNRAVPGATVKTSA